MTRRDPREYGLTRPDRDFEIARKFGPASISQVNALLGTVTDPGDPVLGAIVFLANTSDQVAALVVLANEDRQALMRAATVKEERG